MIDPDHALASWYLWLCSLGFLVVYALPLLFVPLRWARWFRWQVPAHTHLAVYFGRCLGGVALAVLVTVMRGAADPAGNAYAFELFAMIGGVMTAVHVWGAVRRTQPWTETAEIGLYAGLTALAVWLRTTL